MINEKEILARLQKGESIKEIGDSIAKILNSANAQYQNTKAKKAALVSILSELLNWYEAYYEDVGDDVDVEELAQTAIDTIESLNNITNMIDPLVKALDIDLDKSIKKPEGKIKIQSNSFDDLVRAFLGET